MEAIGNFMDYLEFEKRFSVHTLRAYRTDLQQFVQFLRAEEQIEKIDEISSPIIRSWLVKLMEEGIDPRSVNRKITALKTFFKYAMKSRWISVNPMLKVVSPKIPKKLPVYLEASKLNFLLDSTEFAADFTGIRDRLILELFYGTGMRRAELLTSTIEDLDLHQKQLKVTGKRNKQRIIPLHAGLLSLFEQYLELRNAMKTNHSFVFITPDGKQLYPELVYRLVKKQLSKVSTQKKRSPHVLRHSFATEMLNQGADLNAIKEILGHANLSATQVYTHNSIEKLRDVYKKAHPRGEE
jgi:integrase/recombinase XerC